MFGVNLLHSKFVCSIWMWCKLLAVYLQCKTNNKKKNRWWRDLILWYLRIVLLTYYNSCTTQVPVIRSDSVLEFFFNQGRCQCQWLGGIKRLVRKIRLLCINMVKIWLLAVFRLSKNALRERDLVLIIKTYLQLMVILKPKPKILKWFVI